MVYVHLLRGRWFDVLGLYQIWDHLVEGRTAERSTAASIVLSVSSTLFRAAAEALTSDKPYCFGPCSITSMLNGRGTASWCTIEPISYSRISIEYQQITRRDAQYAGQAEGLEGRRRKRNEKAFKVEQEVYRMAGCQPWESAKTLGGKTPRPRTNQAEFLKILEPGNEFPQVVDQFRKTRMQANRARVACFCELKSSNVGKIVGREDRTVGLE